MFLEKVEKTILQYHMLQKGDFVVVGISGGGDSVALLTVLGALRQKYELKIEAVHIHHGLRGTEADRDARFSETFCNKMSIPFHLIKYDIEKEAKKQKMGLEEMGRKCRYKTFEKIAGTKGKIAVAHHQNDQAETVLLNLCRGAALDGLSGMLPVRKNIIRPLLFVTKKEIEYFLNCNHIQHCEDSTNKIEEYTRNGLRLSVLPYLEKNVNRKTIEHIATTASLLAEENMFLEQEAEQRLKTILIEQNEESILLSVPKLLIQHSAMRKRILRKVLYLFYGTLKNISYTHLEQIEQLLYKTTGKSISLPLGKKAFLQYDVLVLQKQQKQQRKEYEYQLVPEKATYIKEIDKFIQLSFNMYKKSEKTLPMYAKAFNYDRIKENVVCRTRKQGDVISISGGHQKKLKDFLIDAKIPRQQRENLLLFAVGKEIFWIPGYRVADGFLADETTKNKILISVWEGEHHEREN